MRMVPWKHGPCVTPSRSVQLLIVWNATCTGAPVRHPARMTPFSRAALVTPFVPPWMSAVKECSPTWTS